MAGVNDAIGNIAGWLALIGGVPSVIVGAIAHGKLIQRVTDMEIVLNGDSGLKSQVKTMGDQIAGFAGELRNTGRRLDSVDRSLTEIDRKQDVQTDRIIAVIKDQRH